MGRVVKERNIALCIIFSIITCGIYGIYWYINMVDDLNALSGHEDDTSGVVAFLLSVVTCNIYNWFWLYKAGKKTGELDGIGGDDSVLYLILAIFGLVIVDYALIQDKINKNANKANVVEM